MAYELKEKDDGTIELVEIVRDVIAIFKDRDHAQHYFGILVADQGAPGQVDLRTLEQQLSAPPAVPMPEPKPASNPKPQTVRVGAATKQTSTPPAAEPQWSTPSDEEWSQAFIALSDGADLKDVAKDLNVNFYKLRGKYANFKRRQNEQATADPATGPVSLDQEECRLCGRVFKATAESDGLCARCSHAG
ncbi:MAG: hypothetical protein CML68_20400 [Rhodobacteraceae bacterium]|nr:hypothetical protein [Paracoccaceae bacterium]